MKRTILKILFQLIFQINAENVTFLVNLMDGNGRKLPLIVNSTLGMPKHPGYTDISSQNTRLFVEQPIRTNTDSTKISLKRAGK